MIQGAGCGLGARESLAEPAGHGKKLPMDAACRLVAG